MFVRACIPCGPRCLRCKLLMESGPVAGEFFMLLMTCFVFCGEKGVKVWSMGKESLRLIVCLSACKGPCCSSTR